MAVSDGHGGTASPRSHLGSRLAVDAATRLLWQLSTPLTEQLLRDCVRQIVSTWRNEVHAHLERHPLHGAEIDQGAAEQASDVLARWEQRPTVAYGATLLFAVIDGQQVGLGQLGDGDILLVPGAGCTHRPLPPDERLLAHTTTSLCDDDPVGNTRLVVLPMDSQLVILSTDGYANSFTDDASFLQVGTDLLAAVDETGISQIRQSLPTWLAETSQQGAGDDISVAIALTGTAGTATEPLSTGPSSAGAYRPAVQLVQVRPVRPADPPTAYAPPAGAVVPATPQPPHPAGRPSSTRPAQAAASSPYASPFPAGPGQRSGRRPTKRRRALVVLVGMTALLGLGTGGYLLLGSQARLPQSPARSPHAVTTQPPEPSVTATVSWALDNNRLTVRRLTGTTITLLQLPSPAQSLLQVPNGALLLLADGQVGLLPTVGALIIGDWQTVPAIGMIKDGATYYLLDSSGHRRWIINPRTGAVSQVGSGKVRPPYGPSASTPAVPTGNAPSASDSGQVVVVHVAPSRRPAA